MLEGPSLEDVYVWWYFKRRKPRPRKFLQKCVLVKKIKPVSIRLPKAYEYLLLQSREVFRSKRKISI